MDVQPNFSRHSFFMLLGVDFPLVKHVVKHQIAACQRIFRVRDRIVKAGAVDNAGQQGRLREVQVIGVGAKVEVGS